MAAAMHVSRGEFMDEKDFKKHLSDLVHGHHHPQEHDWSDDNAVSKPVSAAKPRKRVARKAKRSSK